ncbi:hypothetical protein JOC33_001700 [Thalassobacillus pellis]|nr:hypothetical protein [Thalassobacillus pellis]
MFRQAALVNARSLSLSHLYTLFGIFVQQSATL